MVGDYTPPFTLLNKHVATIYPALFRRVTLPPFQRERVTTDDNDFLDLDWLKQGADQLIIISHGLEGNSQRPYMKGMARAFYDQKFDVLTWNYRGCGDEMNKQLRFYHSGATDDLDFIVKHASKNYKSVYLIGFSLGGNLTLKFLGESAQRLPSKLKAAVAFSVPMNLKTSCEKISEPSNFFYAKRFIKSLKKKVTDKAKLMPGIDVTNIDRITTLKEFDDRYTAPLHGFKDAVTYYEACSSLYFLKEISVPTLVISAKDDPFLSADCYPTEIGNPHIQFDYSRYGGHVGFALFNQNGLYWSELRALQFIQSIH
jgi:predicted alpha/beta-fold hydrolase